MTQLQLARRAGIHQDQISRLECGHFKSPGLRTLLRVATALDITVAGLLPESDGSHCAPGIGASRPTTARPRRRTHPTHLDEFLVDATERELKVVLAVVEALQL